jgi:hypothetical protein
MSSFLATGLNTLITAVNKITASFQTIANLNAADFDAAVTAIGATKTTLVINASQTVSTNVTVPATLTLMFTGAGELSVDAAKTVTINGYVVAEKRQIFSGAGTVTLATSQILQKYWWDGASSNVGLGIDPASLFHIAANSGTAARGTIENTNTGGYADLKLGTDTAAAFLRAHGSTETDTFDGITLDNYCLFETYQCDGLILNADNAGGTAKLHLATEDSIGATLDEAGNFGIDSQSPGARLHVNKTAAGSTIARFEKSADDSIVQFKETVSDDTWGIGLDYSNSNGLSIAIQLAGNPSLSADAVLEIDTAGKMTVNQDAELSAGSSEFDIGWSGTDVFHLFDDNKIAVGTATPDSGIDWHFQADDTTAGLLVTATTGGDARYYLSNVDTLWHMSLLTTDHLVIAEGAAGNVVAKFDPTNHNMTVGGNTTPDANCTLEIVNGPVKLTSYAVASLPTVVTGGIIYCPDETGGATILYSDGVNWRRGQDGAVAS